MDNWTSRIDKITEEFISNFSSLSDEQLNHKPDPKTWSIAQNIEHVIILNESYFPVLDAVKNGENKLPWTAKLGFLVPLFGKMLLKAVQPNRKRKMKTFPVWQPSDNQVYGGIIERFKKHQENLKKYIESSEQLIKDGTIISSPANRNIVYRLDTAFDIIVTHEQRHLEQAKEVLKLTKS